MTDLSLQSFKKLLKHESITLHTSRSLSTCCCSHCSALCTRSVYLQSLLKDHEMKLFYETGSVPKLMRNLRNRLRKRHLTSRVGSTSGSDVSRYNALCAILHGETRLGFECKSTPHGDLMNVASLYDI